MWACIQESQVFLHTLLGDALAPEHMSFYVSQLYTCIAAMCRLRHMKTPLNT
jgi:hypothetical protein